MQTPEIRQMPESQYLLIIDQSPVNEALKNYFAQFNVSIKEQKTLHTLDTNSALPTAILIHWSLLKDKQEIIKQFYNLYPVPLIIIHESTDTTDAIAMLEAGADDVMEKPLYPRELHARIGAITRRILRAQQNQMQRKEVLLFADWRVYPASRRVLDGNNKELSLSVGEYDLLLAFVQQPQRILDREFLLQLTKNMDLVPLDRRIDVQISRLRQKIEVDAKKPTLIRTIRNSGYMFTARVVSLKENEL